MPSGGALLGAALAFGAGRAPPPLPYGMVGPPPGQQPVLSVAGLDPNLVQEVMKLTQQQIDMLPLDKQQGILALRQQITGSMG